MIACGGGAVANGVQLYGAGSPNVVSVFNQWSPAYLFIRDDIRYRPTTSWPTGSGPVALGRKNAPHTRVRKPKESGKAHKRPGASHFSNLEHDLAPATLWPRSVSYSGSGITQALSDYTNGTAVRFGNEIFCYF